MAPSQSTLPRTLPLQFQYKWKSQQQRQQQRQQRLQQQIQQQQQQQQQQQHQNFIDIFLNFFPVAFNKPENFTVPIEQKQMSWNPKKFLALLARHNIIIQHHLQVALYFMHNIKSNKPDLLDKYTCSVFFIGCILLSAKVVDDIPFNNKSFAYCLCSSFKQHNIFQMYNEDVANKDNDKDDFNDYTIAAAAAAAYAAARPTISNKITKYVNDVEVIILKDLLNYNISIDIDELNKMKKCESTNICYFNTNIFFA